MTASRCNLYSTRDLRRWTESEENACAFFENVNFARKLDTGKHYCPRCQKRTQWSL